ncbi:hypothetical protein MLP_00220 [Microlunatus phosphovorus NM-1]|uniref:Uncharacterized protein n=1 Tax=Microlunatus phosphovorus (strain ATCC 700054 / DSM 10555 / JCM 9379 / NBRC 101784 / NCIMB 13414 / VKM Ac-1990 / NM-1) TaxID=1032480 RepID=F5XGC9_MICPN|nr:hypothetical protein MLP_00220 [Microlunatus phosphovorus NM-1]
MLGLLSSVTLPSSMPPLSCPWSPRCPSPSGPVRSPWWRAPGPSPARPPSAPPSSGVRGWEPPPWSAAGAAVPSGCTSARSWSPHATHAPDSSITRSASRATRAARGPRRRRSRSSWFADAATVTGAGSARAVRACSPDVPGDAGPLGGSQREPLCGGASFTGTSPFLVSPSCGDEVRGFSEQLVESLWASAAQAVPTEAVHRNVQEMPCRLT